MNTITKQMQWGIAAEAAAIRRYNNKPAPPAIEYTEAERAARAYARPSRLTVVAWSVAVAAIPTALGILLFYFGARI